MFYVLKRLLTVLFILTAALSSMTRAAEPVPVIFDTDIGSDIDDMVALSLILKSPELDLKLVTTASEDTRYRAQVAAKFLTKAGRTDIPVGMGERFEGKAEFHKPWVADFALSDYQGDIIEDGAGAIIQLLKQSSDPVTIIVAGPMHNIAAVLERAPELASKMRIVGMHGSIYKGYGDEPSAEYNVQNNVPAFRKVLHAPLHSFTITPLDTCGDMIFDGEQYQQLKNSTDKQLEVIFENYPIWAGLVTWENADYLASRSSVMYDAVAVYLALPDHSWLPAEPMHLSVTGDGFTVPADSGPQVNVALEWANRDAFKQWFVERMLTSAD